MSKCVGCLLILIGIAVIGPRTETQWETRSSAQTQSGSARSAVDQERIRRRPGPPRGRVECAPQSSNRTLAACPDLR